MSIISLIAAIDEEQGLGKDNGLLCHLPADLKHFKETTFGKPIIMGRKTYQSIGKALPGRLNIVLSKQPGMSIGDATVLDSLARALALTANAPEVMIIGGAQLFEQALPLADRIYLTLIHAHLEADVFFPPINYAEWLSLESITRERDEKNLYDLTFYCYERKSTKI